MIAFPTRPSLLASRVTLCLLVAAGVARAQNLNVDYGSANPAPSPAYGAAAVQAGAWNVITGLEDAPVALLDVDGAATAVTIEPDLPFGPAASDHPGTSGDVEALLDDYLDLHSVPADFHVLGLQAGTYVVFTYAWAPDEAAFKTSVSVNGSDPQLIGGAWPGELRLGVTHARHKIGIADGESLDIHTFGLGKGTLNGLQIVRVDSPFTDLGGGLAGDSGVPEFFGDGPLTVGDAVTFSLSRAAVEAPVTLVAGLSRIDAPFKGGVLVPAADALLPLGSADRDGSLTFVTRWPAGVPSGTDVFLQCWLPDAAGPQGFAGSNGLQLVAP